MCVHILNRNKCVWLVFFPSRVFWSPPCGRGRENNEAVCDAFDACRTTSSTKKMKPKLKSIQNKHRKKGNTRGRKKKENKGRKHEIRKTSTLYSVEDHRESPIGVNLDTSSQPRLNQLENGSSEGAQKIHVMVSLP